MRRSLGWLSIVALLAVAVTLQTPAGAQAIVRIYGTISGAPIAITASSLGYMNVNVVSGSFAIPVVAPASGTCVTPSFTITGDLDSGMGWLGANNMAACAGGATIFDWNASRVLFAQSVSLASGVAVLPAVTNTSDLGTSSVQFRTAFFATSVAVTSSTAGDAEVGIFDSTDRPYISFGSSANPYNGAFMQYNKASDTMRFDRHGGQAATWSFGSNGGNFTFGATTSTVTIPGVVVTPIYRGSGTGTSVANVGANSCGTSAATIAGNQVSGVITVGATAGTQCRVTFTTAAPVARDCTVTDSTTTVATRATVVDTTNTDFLGAFAAGDKITYQCTVR